MLQNRRLGRLDGRQGLGVMLKAFALLRRRLPEATLVIAGATRRDIYESTREPFESVDWKS